VSLDPAALARVFAAKGRPPTHPLIAHVLGLPDARAVSSDTEVARRLAEAFWPGPLTFVLPRRPEVPAALSGGLPTVAVRAPAHPVARALIEALGEPLAAPSANRYQAVSPTDASHVVAGLGDAVDLVLDGGPAARGIESTVLDLTGPPTILRLGPIDEAALRAIEPGIRRGERLMVNEDEARVAPGLDARHYAPRATVQLFSLAVPATLTHGDGAMLCGAALADLALRRGARVLVLPAEPAGYAAGLYAALHTLDGEGVSRIFVEEPPASAAWDAVRDRLTRSAAPRSRRS
jgi:L-threonylcarbamoyladenylate synthase